MEMLTCTQGIFDLSRYPERRNEVLRAWDAADEYLLNTIFDDKGFLKKSQILIINDGFGALALALASQREQGDSPLWVLSDSYISRSGTQNNFKKNGLDINQIKFRSALELVADPLPRMDLVVLKVPKSLAELEEQLHCIRPAIGPATRVIAAGMTKSIHTSTLNLFESILGPTKTSLAVKKARLIFTELGESVKPPANPFPKEYLLDADLTKTNQEASIFSHGGVFSHASLDMGTRLLLANMQVRPMDKNILDLGCGSGVVGVVGALRNPEAKVTFLDESFLAVASARLSTEATVGTETADRFVFQVGDCLDGVEDACYELVLNNPPFHQRGGQADHISQAMFLGAKRVLKEGGSLYVVGNRHLGYHVRLKKIFGNCRLVAGNAKFVVLSATKN